MEARGRLAARDRSAARARSRSTADRTPARALHICASTTASRSSCSSGRRAREEMIDHDQARQLHPPQARPNPRRNSSRTGQDVTPRSCASFPVCAACVSAASTLHSRRSAVGWRRRDLVRQHRRLRSRFRHRSVSRDADRGSSEIHRRSPFLLRRRTAGSTCPTKRADDDMESGVGA